jgi:glycosyltransferase involved in cell wall biosynthesis
MSVIVPSFNSNETIVECLLSIESQDLPLEDKKKLEVIVVDDGSSEPLSRILSRIESKLSYQMHVVRMESNGGLATARNVGLARSSCEYVVFLDSDILLPKNYMLEHSVRNQLVPNGVFVSMKSNIERSSPLFSRARIRSGLESPNMIDDMRFRKKVSEGQLGIHAANESECLELLNDTNYFREFGFGRTIGPFDLATMVVGHNLSLRRSTIERSQAFSRKFVGWGLEDSYFGARLIASGNFVIPVLSSNVYHVNHPPRSGSTHQKEVEFRKNIQIYHELLQQPFMPGLPQ